MDKFKDQLFNQINPMAVLLELEQYPDKIRDQKSKVRESRQIFTDIDINRASRELEILSAINDETDPATGKPKYSNEKARQAELTKRCRTDQDYILSAKLSKEAQRAADQAQDEFDMLENKYRSCRYRADVVASELRFWAGKEDEEDVHSHQPY